MSIISNNNANWQIPFLSNNQANNITTDNSSKQVKTADKADAKSAMSAALYPHSFLDIKDNFICQQDHTYVAQPIIPGLQAPNVNTAAISKGQNDYNIILLEPQQEAPTNALQDVPVWNKGLIPPSGQKAADAAATAAVAKLIADNRGTIEEHVELKSTKYTHAGKTITGNVYVGNKDSDLEPSALKGASQAKKWAYAELAGEGGATAVNTYDGQLFTFGKGFAGKSGQLTAMLVNWFANEDVAAEFAKYGVAIKNNTLQVVDTTTDPACIKSGKAAYQYIYDHNEMQHLFINIGEDSRFAQSCVDAQYKTCMSYAGNIPAYANNWSENMIKAGVHLTHWMPAIGWKGTNCSDCKTDVDVVAKMFTTLGKKVVAGGVIPSSYNSINAGNNTYVISNTCGCSQVRNLNKQAVWNDLKKEAGGTSVAVTQADIDTGIYSGKLLFEDPKAKGKYYIINQK